MASITVSVKNIGKVKLMLESASGAVADLSKHWEKTPVIFCGRCEKWVGLLDEHICAKEIIDAEAKDVPPELPEPKTIRQSPN